MDAIFMGILDMSIVSAYCIAIVLLIRLLLRKAPKSFSYFLWIVVFVRLALPFTPESPISLVPQAVSENSVAAWINNEATPILDQSVIPASSGIEPMQEANGGNTAQIPADHAIKSLATPPHTSQDQGMAQSQVISPAAPVTSDSAGTMNLSLPQVFSIIWLAGIVVLLSYNVIAYFRLRNRLQSALHLEDDIFVSPDIESPFLLGIFLPRIYIPSNLQESDRAHILRHEQIHIQRGDHIIKAILYGITCIHWFNPLVWLAFAFMSRDMEMSCDEKVIREFGYGIKKNYSSSLLKLATGRNLLHATPLAFGEGSLKGRIKNIVNYRKPALWIILASAILVGLVVTGLIFNPLQRKGPEEKDQTQATEETTQSTATTQGADETSSTTPATTELSETKPISGDPYDNLFIEVDGKQISFRNVLELPSENYQYIYDLSPLDYKTTSPVDVSDFQTVFTDAGYIVEEDRGTYDEQLTSGWIARNSDGEDVVRCYSYASEEDANRVISQMTMEFLYFDAKHNSDLNKWDLRIKYTDSALLIYDTDGKHTRDNILFIAFQSGNSVIQAEIFLNVPRLQTFIAAIKTVGLPFPGQFNLNPNPGEWPENAEFRFDSHFEDVLNARGYEVELYDPYFDWEWYSAYSEKYGVYVCNGLESASDTPGKSMVRCMDVPEDDLFYKNATYEYHSSDSYEMMIDSSDNLYGITVYFDLSGQDTPYDGPYDRNIWYVSANIVLTELSETERAAARAEVDAVIKELCFPG